MFPNLCLTEHHAMKTCWRVEVWLHAFFDIGTRWRRVVSFTPHPKKEPQVPIG